MCMFIRADEPSPGEGDVISPELSHDKLALESPQNSAFVGRRTTPEFWWAGVATLGMLGAFFVTSRFLLPESGARWSDLIGYGVIVAFNVALWLVTRKPSPSIAQGFWEESRRIRTSRSNPKSE